MTQAPPARVIPIGLVLVLLGTAWTGLYAARSTSSGPECYAANVCDGLTFRIVAELLETGQNPYSEAQRLAHASATRFGESAPPFDLPFQYPPNALPLFVPRGWASPHVSHVVFSIATSALFLGLALGLARRHLCDPVSPLVLVGSVAVSGAATFNAQLGQTGALASALIIGAALWWRHAPFRAGLVVGVLAFKPQYAVPLALVALVRRDHQVMLGAIVSAGVLTAGSGLAFGFSQWPRFLEVAGEPNTTRSYMVNWMGLASRVLPGSDFVEQGGLLVFALSMLILGVFVWGFRRRTSLEAQLAVAVAVAVVVSPNTHPYDLLVLVPALAYVSANGGGLLAGPLFFLLTWVLLPPPPRWLLALALVCFAFLTTWLFARAGGAHRCQNGHPPDSSVASS